MVLNENDRELIEACQRGDQEAFALLFDVHSDKIYSIALRYAGDQAVEDPDLSEYDYGDYEGLTTAEIRRSAPGWDLWSDGAPDGETPGDVRERVDGLIREIRSIDGDVALFSHGHLSRALAARWIELPVAAGKSFLFTTPAIGVLGWDRATPLIERWNDDSHLRCSGSSTGVSRISASGSSERKVETRPRRP